MAFFYAVICIDEDSIKAGDSDELLLSLIFSKTFYSLVYIGFLRT